MSQQPKIDEQPLGPHVQTFKRISMHAFVKNILNDNDGLDPTSSESKVSTDTSQRTSRLLRDHNLNEHTMKEFMRTIYSVTSNTTSGHTPRLSFVPLQTIMDMVHNNNLKGINDTKISEQTVQKIWDFAFSSSGDEGSHVKDNNK